MSKKRTYTIQVNTEDQWWRTNVKAYSLNEALETFKEKWGECQHHFKAEESYKDPDPKAPSWQWIAESECTKCGEVRKYKYDHSFDCGI